MLLKVFRRKRRYGHDDIPFVRNLNRQTPVDVPDSLVPDPELVLAGRKILDCELSILVGNRHIRVIKDYPKSQQCG